MKRPGLVQISGTAGSMNSTPIGPHFSLPFGSAVLCIGFTINCLPSQIYITTEEPWAAPAYYLQCPHLSRNGSISFPGIRTLSGSVWAMCSTLGQSLCLQSGGSDWPAWVTCPPWERAGPLDGGGTVPQSKRRGGHGEMEYWIPGRQNQLSTENSTTISFSRFLVKEIKFTHL